jgi:hypothetical protein
MIVAANIVIDLIKEINTLIFNSAGANEELIIVLLFLIVGLMIWNGVKK